MRNPPNPKTCRRCTLEHFWQTCQSQRTASIVLQGDIAAQYLEQRSEVIGPHEHEDEFEQPYPDYSRLPICHLSFFLSLSLSLCLSLSLSLSVSIFLSPIQLSVCMCVDIYIYIYINVHIYICMYLHMYISATHVYLFCCAYICEYVCVDVCVCVCVPRDWLAA